MKSLYIYIVNILTSLVLLFLLGSCVDDTFDMEGSIDLPDNMIRFEVFSGFDLSAYSRSGETVGEDAELLPVVIAQGSDTLYIHRYVASENERATGRNNTLFSRGVQVNDIATFKEFCENFYVKAVFSSDKKPYIPLIKAEPLSPDDTSDTWYIKEPHYYWPVDKELLFNAFAPADAKALLPSDIDEILTHESITFDYTVPVSDDRTRDAEVQPDLMFASVKCSHRADASGDNVASLNFRHALSAIKFAVRDVASGEIVDITIKGVAGTATCTFNPDADEPPAFTWTNLGEKSESYTQKFSYRTTENDHDKIPSLADAPVINNQEGMSDKTFMLIPQEISDDAELIITFKKDGEEAAKQLKGKLKSADIPEWKAGKEYIYTISTTADVWMYVFEVTGSVQQENNEKPDAGAFSSDPNNIIVNPTVTDGAYYTVKSYRQRRNNPSVIEPLAWTATSSNGTNRTSTNGTIQAFITQYQSSVPMTATPAEWFPEIGLTAQESEKLSLDNTGKFGDDGSVEGKTYKVKFKTQFIATDWKGDWDMRGKSEIGSNDDPVDLSLKNCGGKRTTANCYVINRGGWYKFPLVYGNAITNGDPNKDSYSFKGGNVTVKVLVYIDEKPYDLIWSLPSLSNFTDYKGQPISDPYITGAKSVKLVWQDAYGIIDTLKLNNDEVWFHVARTDLQQSNSVIAVCDINNDIIWSWHIWVNEQMVNDDQLLADGIVCQTWNEADQTAGYGPFELAQRNLGWCDPKQVEYLERTGTLTFQQEGGKTPEKTLNVKQRGKVIEFFIANNTYYQWGRKDPMVGFRYSDENEHYVKYNFGEIGYGFMDYTNAHIADGILNPSKLLAGTNGNDLCDWEVDNFYNLWNNYYNDDALLKVNDAGYNEVEPGTNTPLPTLDYAYSAVKTIYDPSPAGFVVPPQKFFEILSKGYNEHRYVNDFHNLGKVLLSDVFNGNRVQKNSYYQYNAFPTRDGSGDATILLTGTGQRWHRSGHSVLPMGGNMNPNHIYLWPNTVSFYYDNSLSFIVGYEQDRYASTTRMLGRRSMARPVRSVKEFTPKTLGR